MSYGPAGSSKSNAGKSLLKRFQDITTQYYVIDPKAVSNQLFGYLDPTSRDLELFQFLLVLFLTQN